MTFSTLSTHTVKAKIIPDQDNSPVQIALSGDAAMGLALIAGNFAKEVEPNSDEARDLIKLAETVSIRLMDCAAAMSFGSGAYQHLELDLAS